VLEIPLRELSDGQDAIRRLFTADGSGGPFGEDCLEAVQ
jgi:hypothetical protein